MLNFSFCFIPQPKYHFPSFLLHYLGSPGWGGGGAEEEGKPGFPYNDGIIIIGSLKVILVLIKVLRKTEGLNDCKTDKKDEMESDRKMHESKQKKSKRGKGNKEGLWREKRRKVKSKKYRVENLQWKAMG